MNICPITYEEIQKRQKYSVKGLRSLSSTLVHLNDLPYTAAEQRREAEARSSKLSIQGVQPKLSATLNVKGGIFEVVDQRGRYILKPQVERFKHLPENEDLTMRLARAVGIETPLHGLVYSKDGSLTYFIKRFDRQGQKGKLHVEDFAQLSGKSRDTKYSSSMEQVAEVIERYCTFPAVEKLELFRRTFFSFLVGNEDMHLKNFTLILKDDKVAFSPAYDLVNSTLALTAANEELALPLKGKKKNLTRNDFFKYFAHERLGITEAACLSVMNEFQARMPDWKALVDRSFLPLETRKHYLEIVAERAKRMGIDAR